MHIKIGYIYRVGVTMFFHLCDMYDKLKKMSNSINLFYFHVWIKTAKTFDNDVLCTQHNAAKLTSHLFIFYHKLAVSLQSSLGIELKAPSAFEFKMSWFWFISDGNKNKKKNIMAGCCDQRSRDNEMDLFENDHVKGLFFFYFIYNRK